MRIGCSLRYNRSFFSLLYTPLVESLKDVDTRGFIIGGIELDRELESFNITCSVCDMESYGIDVILLPSVEYDIQLRLKCRCCGNEENYYKGGEW